MEYALPNFDVLLQDFMEKKDKLVFMRDPVDCSNTQLRKVHFIIVFFRYLRKENTTQEQRSFCHGAFTL